MYGHRHAHTEEEQTHTYIREGREQYTHKVGEKETHAYNANAHKNTTTHTDTDTCIQKNNKNIKHKKRKGGKGDTHTQLGPYTVHGTRYTVYGHVPRIIYVFSHTNARIDAYIIDTYILGFRV